MKFMCQLLGLLMFILQGGFAQKIHLDLLFHKNQQVALVAANGVHKDTLQRITLDAQGKGSFNLTGIKTLAGLVGLVIKKSSPPDVMFEWLYSPTESPVIISSGEYIHSQNTKILNSPETQNMNRWATNDYILKRKQLLLQELVQLCQPSEIETRQMLQNQLHAAQQQHQQLLDTVRNDQRSFAAAMIQFRSNIDRYLAQVWTSDSTRNVARNYFRSLNFDQLYHSGLWFNTINPCIEAYIKGTPHYEKFGVDIAHILNRTHNLAAYTDLAEAGITICEQFSWWNDQNAIVQQLIKDQRIQQPNSPKLQKILSMNRLQAGYKAPDLIVNQADKGADASLHILPTDQLSAIKTLLVFYESGCGNCENTLNQLKGNYNELSQKGWRVISIAADHDMATFQKTAADLPWADKYCDLKGFAGTNFKNYAILGTPTMYLINNDGKIINKTATLLEVLQDKQVSNNKL